MASAVILTYERKPSVSRNANMKQTQSASNGYLLDRGPQELSYAAETVAESDVRRHRFSAPYAAQNTVTSDERLSETASEDSCSLKRKSMSLNGDTFKDAFKSGVRASLRNLTKGEKRQLRRKLKMDLDQVRFLSMKVEVREMHVKGLLQTASMDRHSDVLVARANGFSKVGDGCTSRAFDSPPMDSHRDGRFSRQPSIAIPEHNLEGPGTGNKDKRTPKANQLYVNSEFVSGKDKFLPLEKAKSKGGSALKRNLQKSLDPRDVKRLKLDLSHSKKMADLLKQCGVILKKLMTHRFSWVFNEPVDVVKLNLHDYNSIIKKPMDLGTIKKKLDANVYLLPTEFTEDVRLTFANAMRYNPPGHDVHLMADSLRSMFEEKWKTVEEKMKDLEAQHERLTFDLNNVMPMQSSQMPAQEFHQAPLLNKPAPVRKPKPPQQAKSASKSKAKPAVEPKRAMTFEEKQSLSEKLANLPPDKLDIAVQIMRSKNQKMVESENDIEVDLDSFDIDTLWELHRLVLDSLKRSSKAKKQVERNTRLDPAAPTKSQLLNGITRSPKASQRGEGGDEDVDIGDELPSREFPPVVIDKDRAAGKANSSSSSSSSGSGSSSSDSDSASSSGSDSDGADVRSLGPGPKHPPPEKEPMGSGAVGDRRGSPLHEVDGAKRSVSDLDEENVPATVSPVDTGSQDGDGKEASNERKHRAALLRRRFAETILKAQEKNLPQNKADKVDPEKLKKDREEVEKRKKEERARLQAEAKAAEVARKKAEAEAAAEVKRRREAEREAARLALQNMEKTVEIDENSEILKDLEMLRTAPEHIPSSGDETSSVLSPDGMPPFALQGGNPLEQLGLFMKNDEDDEDREDLKMGSADEDEEGEIED